MRSLRELLDGLPIPAAGRGGGPEYALPAASLLGADLPPGRLHVWSGPKGAGETALLLGLLHDAARHGRCVVFATYDLSAGSLALRLLAMASGVPLQDLEDLETSVRSGRVAPEASAAAARARARLSALPFHVLEARGMSVTSIEDRLVRSPVRPEVLGVDYLEAVVDPAGRSGAGEGGVLADLAALAARRYLAVVGVARAEAAGRRASLSPFGADRLGRLSPLGETAASVPPRRDGRYVDATLIANRHGVAATCRLRVDAAAARLLAPEASASLDPCDPRPLDPLDPAGSAGPADRAEPAPDA